MSYNNYNAVLEQFVGLAKFGQSAYKSGEQAQDKKDKIRSTIINFRKIANENDDIELPQAIDQSRELLEHYLHNFGNPQKVPDIFFDHLDNLKRLIKITYVKMQEAIAETGKDFNLMNSIDILCERYIEVISKILRLAYTEKAPPMTLPSASDLHIPRVEPKSVFD
ncbi:MAG: hypothetical protein INQ03_13740 [Candidatus Heimdallarchaeota archaeon]|nr:hypothetical protein [Candidatus Heimdallarchaeota archaeon]